MRMLADPDSAASQGIWKLIWPGETNHSGAGLSFTVTITPFRLVGRGTNAATAGGPCGARLTPKIELTDPRVKASAKLAPLVTPPAVKDGTGGAGDGRGPDQKPRPAPARGSEKH